MMYDEGDDDELTQWDLDIAQQEAIDAENKKLRDGITDVMKLADDPILEPKELLQLVKLRLRALLSNHE